MKWKKDDIRFEYRPFYILSFLLLSLFFILYSLFASSSASQFLFLLYSKTTDSAFCLEAHNPCQLQEHRQPD